MKYLEPNLKCVRGPAKKIKPARELVDSPLHSGSAHSSPSALLDSSLLRLFPIPLGGICWGRRSEGERAKLGFRGFVAERSAMSIVPKETIEVIAQSVGIPSLGADVAVALAPDVEYRLREIMQVRPAPPCLDFVLIPSP